MIINLIAGQLDPPKVVTKSMMPINLTINNYNLSLECEGMPNINAFNYTWERENNNLPLERIQVANLSNMIINNIKPGDSGCYRCVASNSTGTISSECKNITIEGIG